MLFFSACSAATAGLDPSTAQPRPFAECQWSRQWSSVDTAGQVAPRVLSSGPNAALVYSGDAFGGRFLRGSDGQAIGGDRSAVPSQLDGRWTRVLEESQRGGSLLLRAVPTGEVLLELGPPVAEPEWRTSRSAQLSASGAVVVTVDCEDRHDGAQARTVVGRREVGGAHAELITERGCARAGLAAPRIVADLDASLVFVVGLDGGAIARADFSSGEIDVRAGVIGEEHHHIGGRDREYYGGIAVGAALSADADGLAFAGWDGWLRLFDSSLSSTAPPIAVATLISQDDTFLPSVESPVALSPDGSVIAHLDEDGLLGLYDRTGTRLIAQLAQPFAARDDGFAAAATPSAPVALAFDQYGLLVAYEDGIARFSCDGGAASAGPGPAPLEITLGDVPQRVRRGQAAHVQVEIVGAAGPVVLELVGEDIAVATLSQRIRFVSYSPGRLELHVRASDGQRTALSSTFVVEVTD